MSVEIYASNYRGFKDLRINLDKNVFLLGDNSSGKSSILHLIEYIFGSELMGVPQLNEKHAYDRYDVFSPYFHYDDVTIGFITREKKNFAARMITIRRGKDLLPPTIIRFTSIFRRARFSIHRRASSTFYKVDHIHSPDMDSLKEMHFQTTGFKTVAVDEDEELEPINSFTFMPPILSGGKINQEDQTAILRGLTTSHLNSAAQTGPLRGRPERFYSFDRKYQSSGTHFASMWHNMRLAPIDALEPVLKFGRESQLFENLDVERVTKKVPHSPLLVTMQKQGRNFLLSQVGIGVSQVIPIVIDSAFRRLSEDNSILLLQQPELHLHPIAQAALGEFLFTMSASGLKYVVETHSDFLLDRFRANMHESNTSVGATIGLCENKPNGNHFTQIEISKSGEIENPPANYKDFFVNELMRTMF